MLALRLIYGGFAKCIARPIRDPIRGRTTRDAGVSGGRSLRSDHRLLYGTPPALLRSVKKNAWNPTRYFSTTTVAPHPPPLPSAS